MCFGGSPKIPTPPPPPPAPPPPTPLAISKQPKPSYVGEVEAGSLKPSKKGKSALTIPFGGTTTQTGMGY